MDRSARPGPPSSATRKVSRFPPTVTNRDTADSDARYRVIVHALTLCRAIAQEPRTRAELAELLGMHERSVRRIIDALVDAGVPIKQTRRANTGWPMEYSAPKNWHK